MGKQYVRKPQPNSARLIFSHDLRSIRLKIPALFGPNLRDLVLRRRAVGPVTIVATPRLGSHDHPNNVRILRVGTVIDGNLGGLHGGKNVAIVHGILPGLFGVRLDKGNIACKEGGVNMNPG